jgi:cytochrome c-type biogenesis protein CcmH
MALKASYVLMAIVLASALWFGTRDNKPPTAAERATALEQSIKCPVCRGQSVAESESEASKAIRTEIARRIDAGQSDSEIRAYFAKTLGNDILLRPPSSGLAGLVWVLPIAGLVGAGLGIALAFRRWHRWGRVGDGV